MNRDKLEILERCVPATEADILRVEELLKCSIPNVYKDFLYKMNGASLNLCALYGTDSIYEMYQCHEFAKYAPQYISIGNDNGGSELIMYAQKDAFQCGFIDAGAIGTTEPEEWFDFKHWVESGCEMIKQNDLSQKGKVLLVKLPENKLKGLMEMKKVFALKDSTSKILKDTQQLPYVVDGKIVRVKAEKLMQKTGIGVGFVDGDIEILYFK